MDAETHANVTTYIEYVHNVCANDNEEALFITLEGKAFDQSNIGKKIASSATFDMDIVEKRAIHEHMAHKEETVDHFYNIGHITKKSSKARRSPASEEDPWFG
ncbi:hypothetical protein ACROYT_G021567 [Oculina patagonica]